VSPTTALYILTAQTVWGNASANPVRMTCFSELVCAPCNTKGLVMISHSNEITSEAEQTTAATYAQYLDGSMLAARDPTATWSLPWNWHPLFPHSGRPAIWTDRVHLKTNKSGKV
jgi:hypothetical protein